MPTNLYDMFDGASQILGSVGSAAGTATPLQNPVGGIQSAQAAYHMHQFGKIKFQGMRQALLKEDTAILRNQEMQTPQVQASDMSYGKNGITQVNGFQRDGEGRITYGGGSKR
ncbi:hypothetical protein P168DRAFT_335205 [Aspergillus campestris IBT 28561]|uniref:Uncharacterized protein n=1 Tax=Aspergillus campestris (strain IBT 28561) TaxID=1392248 RepID=A0A2I1CU79_ASPC2|nr:uncharacterized protein P168DRAFT_335205 [Aspergillus campestris IBT 28561]PKY01178.1 hypothetical protein P168DRAFT_335205 [Aspergillus campestris IBT 28561]